MRKYILTTILFLSACNTTLIPVQKTVSESDNETVGVINERSFPIEATKFVSLHADRSLRLNGSCTQVLKLNLVQRKDYKDTITELKNRAILMGGNSISLVGWREQAFKTTLLGNIYMCEDKTFHLHPHPRI